MSLAPGARLGPYEVLSAIGVGGMGEVYHARDTRLNRDVAIKILPEHFAADTDRIARFQREAQVLASLNHPNIRTYMVLKRQAAPRRWSSNSPPRADGSALARRPSARLSIGRIRAQRSISGAVPRCEKRSCAGLARRRHAAAWANNELFYVTLGRRIMSVAVTREPALNAGTPQMVIDAGEYFFGILNRTYDVPADGNRFLLSRRGPSGNQAVVVLNWREEVNRMLSARD